MSIYGQVDVPICELNRIYGLNLSALSNKNKQAKQAGDETHALSLGSRKVSVGDQSFTRTPMALRGQQQLFENLDSALELQFMGNSTNLKSSKGMVAQTPQQKAGSV